MRPIVASVGSVGTVSANNIALSQTPGAAGALTLNGSLATTTAGVTTAVLPTPQRVLISTTDSTHNFTITGTSQSGSTLTELVPGSAATTYTSALDYATVTSVLISGAATAAVTVGTSGVASTAWVRLDPWASPQIGIQCTVSGTVNYTVQSSYDDPNSPTNPVTPANMTWVNTSDTNAVGATATVATNYLFAPLFVRTLLNSGSGSVVMTVIQYNVVYR